MTCTCTHCWHVPMQEYFIGMKGQLLSSQAAAVDMERKLAATKLAAKQVGTAGLAGLASPRGTAICTRLQRSCQTLQCCQHHCLACLMTAWAPGKACVRY
jgi:hypothetical protein